MTSTEISSESRPVPEVKDVMRPRRRKKFSWWLKVTHRWVSLLVGLLIAVISTTGAVLVFQPELTKLSNQAALETRGTNVVIGAAEAADILRRQKPDAKVTVIQRIDNTYVVGDSASSKAWGIDATTGEVRGAYRFVPEWLQLFQNIHMCALSCETRVGYAGFMAATVPGGEVINDGRKLTVAGLVLALSALLMLFLALTGVWLWWPKANRWKQSVQVRWEKGRFARDTDLHKVVGLVAIPLLAVWGWTGAGFELAPVKQLWYSATFTTPRAAIEQGHMGHTGSSANHPQAPGSVVPLDVALSRAQAAVPGAQVHVVTLPDPKKAASTYAFRMSRPDGDMMAFSTSRGDVRVSVDKFTGEAKLTRNLPNDPLAQKLWETWNYPLHAGFFLPWWARTVWFVLGLSPLVLMVTGLSTWLVRRRSQKNRRDSARARNNELATIPMGS